MRNKLTHRAVVAAKPADRPYRLTDGGQLYLLVKPSGARLWRLDYQLGKRKTLALGVFPDVSLVEARKGADAARERVAAGIDPIDEKKDARAGRNAAVNAEAETFDDAAARWSAAENWSPGHRRTVEQRIAYNLSPWIGTSQIELLTVAEVDRCLTRTADRGALETAHRCAALVRTLYRTRHVPAAVRGRLSPMADVGAELDALPEKRKRAKLPAITDPQEFGVLLRRIERHRGSFVVSTATRLAPYLLLRPGELRHLRWADVRFGEGVLYIPGETIDDPVQAARRGKRSFPANYQAGMKGGLDHIVPLAPPAVALLRDLHAYTGTGGFVFPSPQCRPDAPLERQRPISENAINVALRAVGIDTATEHCAHGFRATARTIGAQRLGVPTRYIEVQLAHVHDDPLHGSYDRESPPTRWLDERGDFMLRWAELVDRLRDDKGGNVVVPFVSAA